MEIDEDILNQKLCYRLYGQKGIKMGNREQFSCRLDQGTIEKLKYLHDTYDRGYGQLIDIAIKLLYRIDSNYPREGDVMTTVNYIMEDFYE